MYIRNGEQILENENTIYLWLMSKHSHLLETVNEISSAAAELGIAHQTTEDQQLDGRLIHVKGRELINFSSCSYLGLELDERLKDGAIDAIRRYGTQFSSSRAYMSVTLYKEAETLLSEIFEKPVVLAPTVTLGHISNIPVLVDDNDIVITDAQVHESVATAVQLLKARHIPVEMVRHSNMEALEERIQELSAKYNKIWYMADGVYSMYGDFIPIDEVVKLLDKYENFYTYIDDSHGMSWAGKNGAGYVLGQVDMHPKMYITTGLAKSFGVCGGVLIFPNEDAKNLVRHCGKTLMFSGPIQPANLGAIIASAKIHLSEEIYGLQQQMVERINYFRRTADKYNLPLIGGGRSPIFFIGLGRPKTGYSMVSRIMNRGFFANLSVFPSVSYKHTGLRIPITLHHTFEDIDDLLRAIAEELPEALHDAGSDMDEIHRAFNLPVKMLHKKIA